MPPDLASLPDAEPRIEPIRSGGANKPYTVLGRDYVPITRDSAFSERGLASWYGKKFHGRRTANGETYDMYAMTAAHPTLPLPSYARIRNPANGREVVVRINDRGPFHAGRIVDLSYAAALAPRPAARRRAGGAGAPHLRRDPRRHLAPRGEPRRRGWPSATRATRRGEATQRRARCAGARCLRPPSFRWRRSPAEPDGRAGRTRPAAPPWRCDRPPAAAGRGADAARGFWVQLGAFRESAGAESFQRRVGDEVEWLVPLLATFGDATLYRVQAGPYASRADAQGAAARVRDALGLVPVIVERR